jgi:hypothetical protein
LTRPPFSKATAAVTSISYCTVLLLLLFLLLLHGSLKLKMLLQSVCLACCEVQVGI